MSKKIERSKDPPDCKQTNAPRLIPASRSDLALPKDVIVETTGDELLIVLDYIIEQIIHREPKLSALEPP